MNPTNTLLWQYSWDKREKNWLGSYLPTTIQSRGFIGSRGGGQGTSLYQEAHLGPCHTVSEYGISNTLARYMAILVPLESDRPWKQTIA